MVRLFAGGQPVGVIPDPDGVIAGLIARNQKAELRDDAGDRVGLIVPDAPPRSAGRPVSFDPPITAEELNRRAAGPFVSFDEMKKRLGWE
jgi:hypothetical protein